MWLSLLCSNDFAPQNHPQFPGKEAFADAKAMIIKMNTSDKEKKLQEEAQLDTPEENSPSSVKLVRELYDWVEIFVVTISAILLVFTFVIRIAYVDGPSMNNTLYDGETLAVSNFFYTPKHGDIVVFQDPDSSVNGGVVKRVIATEGQIVDIDFENWEVYVDGVLLEEPYVNYIEGSAMRSYDVSFPMTVPEGEIFVMGDNRNQSNDSRASDIGCVDTRFIFGKVLFRITPLNKFGAID